MAMPGYELAEIDHPERIEKSGCNRQRVAWIKPHEYLATHHKGTKQREASGGPHYVSRPKAQEEPASDRREHRAGVDEKSGIGDRGEA